MPSLKDLRNRIASVKATQKITKAMQMVATARLRRAQQAAEAARPYAQRMEKVLANLAGSISPGAPAPALLGGTGRDDVHLLVVCTGERGLSGAFNTAIVRLAREHALTLMSQGKTVKFFCVGKKGYDLLRRQFERQIIERTDLRGVRNIGFDNANEIGRRIIALYDAGEFDVCTLYFARFKSIVAQIPTAQQLIPAQVAGSTDTPAEDRVYYDYEPDEEDILTALLPRNISVQVFRALLENMASFYGAQMSAMDNATRNAGEMIRKQTMLYNRTRQAMITKELIEIISGAEAL
ncbi:MAG TPA: F0F1 ATP synthase subunit gamma [Beijerinckiaceae bacterium]|jgi:F-type H+-transporting ATPase subunit gamma|nr:F0F1 ATP synthase subunit gamma [Beijerinckiaceae bacterium]